MRRVQTGTGRNCGTQSGLLSHLALHDGINRIERLRIRREKRVEGDRFLPGNVVIEALVEGGRTRTTEIFEDLEYDASSAAGGLSGVVLLGGDFHLVRHIARSGSLRRGLCDVDETVSILTEEIDQCLIGIVHRKRHIQRVGGRRGAHIARRIILERAAEIRAHRVSGRDSTAGPTQQGSGRNQCGRHDVAHRSTCPRRLRTAEMPSRQRTWPLSRRTANVLRMSACPGRRPPSSPTAAADPAGGSLRTVPRAQSRSCWSPRPRPQGRTTTPGRPRRPGRRPTHPQCRTGQQVSPESVPAQCTRGVTGEQVCPEGCYRRRGRLPDSRSDRWSCCRQRRGRATAVAVELQDVRQVVATLRVSGPEIVALDVGAVVAARTRRVAAGVCAVSLFPKMTA